MSRENGAVRFLYGNAAGRALLQALLALRFPAAAASFLRSPLSRPWIGWYARRNGIPAAEYRGKGFRSFGEFFVRERDALQVDKAPDHLVSPCDGLLSAHAIRLDSSFFIKGVHYPLEDLFQDRALAASLQGGLCLIFRLCPSDYHRYIYVDDGFQGKNHQIPGALHSVQPIACETAPVYVRNRRAWTVLETRRFGKVVQVEVGALAVGGIVNERENCHVRRGMEKGRFELAGSTILLLFQPGRVSLLPRFRAALAGREVPVRLGEQIGEART